MGLMSKLAHVASGSEKAPTQLFEGSALNVQVPGGQKYFLDADGALSFTAPNSSITPRGAVLNATAYQNGMFAYDEVNFPPSAWVACPKINGSSHTGSRAIANGVWQVFGQLKGVNFHAQQGCQGITLLAKAVQNGSVAAYEYT
ncbi:MAG: hypothetical protein M1821_008042 [Bathelium mastoideum]|nr:MAG: hypothetical protein M1821_008042 [Bathelium mastoideum]